MRALIIRPDDAELFQNIADPEKFPFYLSHLPAFKRMWAAEGKVYWLRFLLAFKSNFESTFMTRPECRFVYEMDEEVQFQSFVFINIHKKFVHDSYSVAKTFMEHILVVAVHLENLKEPNRMKNPFYTKETREAFREIFGTPEVDEDIPAGPIAFLSNIYNMFMASVSSLLKRWLKEPDLSDDAKKNVDYTYCYWKPTPEWSDKDFWPSCFEKYLADVYGDALPKMLLTVDIHNIFLNHDDCACINHPGGISIFKVFRPYNDHEPFCMNQVGYLQPSVLDCASHSNCYRKILHHPKCPEPYLCEGSDICILTCEKNRKKFNSGNKPTSFWKKIVFETFTCKLKNKRHVSTYAESHSTEVETFVHQRGCCKSKNLREEQADEFMMNMCGDPELLNSFNQHKRKEEFKNRLRSKFHQKYCFDANDFKDSSYCMSLYENANKTWIFGMLDEKLRNRKYADGSVLSMEIAGTTVAVGTNSVLTGRIVLPSLNECDYRNSPCVCEKVNQEPPILESNESKVKPKSKRSRSKKKKKANANGVSKENNDSPSTSTNVPTVKEAKEPSDETLEKKKGAISVPLDQTSTESENAKNSVACSAEKQQISHTNEIPQKVNHPQHENKSETNSKVIVKEPTSVNKSDSDDSRKECPLLNGDISKDAEDKVENSGELCFGDCVPQNTIGHMCSKAVCSLKACCQCCVFKKEKREFSTQTDTFQDCPKVITEKPKKAPKPKVNLIREAAHLNVKAEEQLKNCSNLKYTLIQIPKDGENSKMTTLESNSSNGSSDDSQTIKSIEATSKDQHTVEDSAVNLKDTAIQIPKDGDNSKLTTIEFNINNGDSQTIKSIEATSKDQHTVEESVVNLKKDTAIQIQKDGDNSMKLTALESNVNNGVCDDSQTFKPIEETNKDQYTVEESVVSINNIPDESHSDQKDAGNENLVPEFVENECGSQNIDGIVEMKSSGNVINDGESISDTVAQDTKEDIDNLTFENDGDKTVEDFLTLIGILNKPSNSEEEIKPDSVTPSTNYKCDTEVQDKKFKFKTCAFCGKKEVVYKTFKRCAKCKADNFAVQRYYCSRQCQVDDWQELHRDEHLKKS